MDKIITLKVGNNTNVISLKTSLFYYIKSGLIAHVDAIGIQANYIVIKAIIALRGSLNGCGYTLINEPYYHEFQIENPIDNNPVKTGIRWVISGVNKL